jgi:hypothetical protein
LKLKLLAQMWTQPWAQRDRKWYMYTYIYIHTQRLTDLTGQLLSEDSTTPVPMLALNDLSSARLHCSIEAAMPLTSVKLWHKLSSAQPVSYISRFFSAPDAKSGGLSCMEGAG